MIDYKEETKHLYELLNNIKIPFKPQAKKSFGKHRAMCLGMIRARFTGNYGLSKNSIKYPEIYAEVMRIGKLCCPFVFNSIHVNHNVTCPAHFDSKNVGDRCLLSFGDYEGGNIVIEGVLFDAKYCPIIFNGSLKQHWNTDDLQGNKYSLVFYNSSPLKVKSTGL